MIASNVPATGRSGPGIFLLHGFLITLSILVLYPVIFMVLTALKNNQDFFLRPLWLPSTLQWANFVQAWRVAKMGVHFLNSIIITGGALALLLITGSMASYAIARLLSRLGVYLYLFFLAGIMIPGQMAIIPIYLMLRDMSLHNTHLGVILVEAAFALPLTIFILTGFLRMLPKELEEAARIDGASELSIFWRIMLPLCRPALAAVTIFSFVSFWNEFLFPLVLLTKNEMTTVTVGLMAFRGEYVANYTLMFAGLTLATIPIVALYLAMQRQFIEGLTAGALAG